MRTLCSILAPLLLGLPWSPEAAATASESVGTQSTNGVMSSLSEKQVDLRPVFAKLGLEPRRQGARPTCSVFTVAGALEFAIGKQQGDTPRLSVEFLNWAANQACGDKEDGGFFSDLWKGFSIYGICTEEDMPYQSKFEPARLPEASALGKAKGRLTLGLQLHWIKEWNVNTGLTEAEFSGVKNTLARGWPVCGGFRWPKQETWLEGVLQMCPSNAVRDGHSVLLAGYREDAAQPGGGVFIFRNTGGNGQDGLMPFAYARLYMNDAVWVDSEPDLKQRAIPTVLRSRTAPSTSAPANAGTQKP